MMKLLVEKYGGIVLICILFFSLGIPLLNDLIIYTPDSARYLIWANTLAKFKGFVDATEPETTRYVIHAPFYPILLAPSAFLFPNNIIAAKATTLIIGCMLLAVFFLWLKRSIGKKYALLGTLFLALNPMIFVYSAQLLSDVPFVLCFVLILYFTEQMLEQQVSWKIEFAFIAIITAGVLMREIGLTLLFSSALFFFLKKHYRRAIFFFFTPLIFYGLWFLRNEVIVAGFENPLFRNTQLFFQNIYTTTDASLFQELIERIQVNFNVYLKHIGKLLFLSDEQSYSYLTTQTSNKFIHLTQRIFAVDYWIIASITSLFTFLGLWKKRKSALLLLIGLFFILYCVVILVYPINDIRFLLPITIIILYFFIHGVKHSIEEWRINFKLIKARYLIAALLFFLLCINVNLLWTIIGNNWQYSRAYDELYKKITQQKVYPETYTKPFRSVANWIANNSDSSDVIISRKEIALWLEGRKVLLTNPRSSTVAINRRLRDYDVKYLVAVKYCLPISEYEELLTKSEKYDFSLVYTAGDIEVYKVFPKGYLSINQELSEADSSVRSKYDEAIRIIENEPIRAEKILREIADEYKNIPIVRYNIAIAMEFAGQLDSADVIFKEIRSMPQAGFFLQQVQYHRKIISLMKEDSDTLPMNKRAEIYYKIASNYWVLGYQKQAMKMLKKSLTADSTLQIANIYSVLFPLLMSDTAQVRNSIKNAGNILPENNYIKNTKLILSYYDSLSLAKSTEKQKQVRMNIVKAYLAMNLSEEAIDELIKITKISPEDEQILFQIGFLLEAKRSYFSALRYYRKVSQINPSNLQARQKVFLLSSRLEK